MKKSHEIIVAEEDGGSRLDIYLAMQWIREFSRAKLQKLIKDQRVTVNGRGVRPHYLIKTGEKIALTLPEEKHQPTKAEPIPLDVLYEDEDVLVINKPVGMVVHPAHGNPNHTLVNALLFHIQNLSEVGDSDRPGIVHRLDKDTSGSLVVAKNDQAHRYLSEQFRKHTIDRVYHAFVRGVVQYDEGVCEEPVGRAFLSRKKVIVRPSGGREAKTCYVVKKRFHHASLVEIRPQTGRTHQIRVHFSHMGHPLLGDSLYGVQSKYIKRQALHATSIAFDHPRNQKRIKVEAPWPEDMKNLLEQLESPA